MVERTGDSSVCRVAGEDCRYQSELLQLRQEVEQLTEQARTDALTGLFNFRHFNETLNHEMERVRRSGQPLALVIGDIDHFKRFNDTHGHEMGNRLLQAVAGTVDRQLRKLDIACRYGGEEFAVILPGTPLGQASKVAERIRAAVESLMLEDEAGQPLQVTMSLGVAGFVASQTCTPSRLIDAADAELYSAKAAGRNRVSTAREKLTADQSVTNEEKSALFALLRDDDSQTNRE